jgi:hypothetical protein
LPWLAGKLKHSRVRRFLSACGYLFVVLVLGAVSRELWQHRFIPAAGQLPLVLGYIPPGVAEVVSGAVDLPAGRGGAMGLTAAEKPPQVMFQWFTEPSAPYAYIAVEAGCEGVVQGLNYWDDARVTVTWVDRTNKRLPDFLPVWSARNTHEVKFREVILPMTRKGGLPRVGVENLGYAGHMTLKSLTVQPVVERPWFRWAAAGLVLIWMGTLYAGLRRWVAREIAAWRIVAAAAVCVIFTWYAAFPGPWMPLQPLQERFAITPLAPPEAPPAKPVPAAPGPEIAETPAPTPAPVPPPPVAKPVEIPAFPAEVKGPPEKLSGSTVRAFVTDLPFLKIYVHFFAFAGLAAALAFLTGTRRAAYVAGALGFLSEFCEWAFGFGVDWGDAQDLVMDATAVLAGMIFWKLASKWLVKRWGLRLA